MMGRCNKFRKKRDISRAALINPEKKGYKLCRIEKPPKKPILQCRALKKVVKREIKVIAEK
jgi:hypothetical protein